MDDNSKTVYRYDSGGKGFRKLAFLLMGLAGVLAILRNPFPPESYL
jgi:hypothetical protein